MDGDIFTHERKEKAKAFIKEKYSLIVGFILLIIIGVASYIRTRPMSINTGSGKPGLWDITTNTWTLGPDLDPFLFLRWAKEIVQQGSLFAIDNLRNAPLGASTSYEINFLAYLIAWFHNTVNIFTSTTVEYSAVIFPVAMFAFTVLTFFLFVRTVFIDEVGKGKADAIALISSFFLSVMPSLLPRTIAGIPEKESVAFGFMFLAFYLFLVAWKGKFSSPLVRYCAAAGAGIFTGAMALTWGGYAYIFLTITVATFLLFLFNQINKEKISHYFIWLIFAVGIMTLTFTTRYKFLDLFVSTTTVGAVAFIPALFIFHFILFNTYIKKIIENSAVKSIPKPLITVMFVVIFGLLVILLLPSKGFSFISHLGGDIVQKLVTPVVDRFGVTVAENKQPYFAEWAGSFGPSMNEFLGWITGNSFSISQSAQQFLSRIPIIFWLFFIGSVYLFFVMIKDFRLEERTTMTFAYTFFLICLVFSRYSDSSLFNGVNTISKLMYVLGFLVLFGITGYFYFKSYKNGESELFKKIDLGYIIIFIFFFLSIISARGSVRTIMVLVPPAAVLVGYLSVMIIQDFSSIKERFTKNWALFFVIFVAIMVSFAGIYFYNVSKQQAYYQVPNVYTFQWQKAMDWVRQNTQQDAVFGHWWDYGYWLQSIGQRATVLDGGNKYVYWNHMMGRYALTGRDDKEAIDFLYAHNTTHLLIDSTDIGKYGAFSSIGSDVDYDRRSWISTLIRDDQRTIETKNATIIFYLLPGNSAIPLDQDIVYEVNGTKKFLPEGSAVLGGVRMEINKQGELAGQPEGIYIYKNTQYIIPHKYIYLNGNLTTFKEGIEAGTFIFSRVISTQNGDQIQKNGAMLYLTNKTVKSQVARLFLYKEDNPYFKLVHTEDSFLVNQLKSQYGYNEDFVLYNEVSGPIRIWEIQYPKGMSVDEKYLETDYPDIRLTIAT